MLEINRELITQIVSVIDLTSLGDEDTSEIISALCHKAVTPKGKVAALCIYPKFISQVVAFFPDKPVEIATVVNFPQGQDDISKVEQDIKLALAAGADEIDVVFPYQRYLNGDPQGAIDFIKECRKACGEKTVKVILETGAISDLDVLSRISHEVIMAGADFLKTSTGKISVGASLEAAEIMLLDIRHAQPEIKKPIGFKASGGIRTLDQAAQYIELANHIMGEAWVSPKTFRIGASQLLDVALKSL